MFCRRPGAPRGPHSFPTRRSSDLGTGPDRMISYEAAEGEEVEIKGSAALKDGWEKSTGWRSEEHTSELQSRLHLVCRLRPEKKNKLSSWSPDASWLASVSRSPQAL